METMELMNTIKIYCKYIIAFILYIGLLLIGAIGGGTRPSKDIWDDFLERTINSRNRMIKSYTVKVCIWLISFMSNY